MKLYKILFIAAIAIGFMACNADDQPEVLQQDGDTYASITVKFPGTVTRALPGDYNTNGTWTGRDNLNTVDVFLVNTAKNVVDYNSFAKNSFAEITTEGILMPNLALKATPGDNVLAYVVINGNTDILDDLRSTAASGFAAKFADVQSKIASELASYADGKETIMMTNDVGTYSINVASGVDEETAKAGTGGNHVQVQVERVVSRAFMTVTPGANGWPVNEMINGVETAIATVKEVNYSVGQSNQNFYLMKQSDYRVPTPVYEYISLDADWATTNSILDYSEVGSYSRVTQWTYVAAEVSNPLAAETTSKFVLPVNHLVDAADMTAARAAYKKGNTTYFEIQAKFMPLLVNGATPTFTEPTTVFWGANDKKFYSTRALAEAEGQQATEFTDGIMKYVLWLNPNELKSSGTDPEPKISPTVRNQVYHAHINEFLRMGLPNNPLNPSDPDDTANPDNPINPGDPLKTDFTYLSVSVKVLPWTIHSYQYSLTDPGTMY